MLDLSVLGNPLSAGDGSTVGEFPIHQNELLCSLSIKDKLLANGRRACFVLGVFQAVCVLCCD